MPEVVPLLLHHQPVPLPAQLTVSIALCHPPDALQCKQCLLLFVLYSLNLGTISSDLQCLCTNQEFGQAVTMCVEANCTPAEQAEALQIAEQECSGN